jgi:myo-inositol-1-phosphate synthase
MGMGRIRIAIAGVGNCARALVQGLHLYGTTNPEEAPGLMHWDLGGYRPGDIEVVAAFDVDQRKVGRDLSEAIQAAPNCAQDLGAEVPSLGVEVRMGPVLDGVSDTMRRHEDEEHTFLVADAEEPDEDAVVEALKASGAELLLNYLPVGSEKASRFYANCALQAGVGFINNIPTLIASDPDFAQRFEEKGLPLVGDDVMSQLGATVTHRALAELFRDRGLILDRTYQLNTGGNTDFLNMTDNSRLRTKRISKTEAVQSAAGKRLPARDIHVGPSDYVPWQLDNKVCFLRLEGRGFGGFPVQLELRLSVEDSPNSAGVVIDAIRCAKLALDRGVGGVLHGPSAYFCKHPPRPCSNEEARRAVEAFIAEEG